MGLLKINARFLIFFFLLDGKFGDSGQMIRLVLVMSLKSLGCLLNALIYNGFKFVLYSLMSN